MQIGLSWTCRTVFWLVCALALCGLSWREFPAPEIRSPGIALALIAWVGIVLILFRLFDPPTEKPASDSMGYFLVGRLRPHSILVPALVLGLLLPLLWFPLYVLFLGLIETVFWLRERRRTEIDAFSEEEPIEEEESTDETMIQQTTRFRTEEGTDRFEGTFCVEFLDDQKTTSVHVPFCPMFDSTPKIEAFLLDAVDAKLTVDRPQPFGVRVEVKRSEHTPPRFSIMLVAESPVEPS